MQQKNLFIKTIDREFLPPLLEASLPGFVQSVKVLCDKNLKIGDEVVYQMEGFNPSRGVFTKIDTDDQFNDPVIIWVVESAESIYCFYPELPEISSPSERPFKILGNLSTYAAAHVIENQEFDEDEVKKDPEYEAVFLLKDRFGNFN